MRLIGGFFKLLINKPALFLYLFILVTAGALFQYIIPAGDILSGLFELAGASAHASVITVAQWITADDMLPYALMFAAAAPLPLAMLCSLLFSGAMGSFAAGMGRARGFPAPADMGVSGGYRSRFFHMFLLFYAALLALFLFAFVWAIAAVPLAIVMELKGRGAIRAAASNAAAAVTALVAYIGFLFLRIYPLSFLPAFYSDAPKPVKAALSMAGKKFFHIAKCFFVSDAVFASAMVLYSISGKPEILLFVNCLICALLVFFLVYAVFDAYPAGENSLEEYGGGIGAETLETGGFVNQETGPVGGFEVVGNNGEQGQRNL